MENETNFCAVCKEVAVRKCGGCQAVYYCNEEHQKSHWKAEHSKKCPPYKLVENDRLGRHYVATRRIKPGEIVISDDSPLITTPNCMKTFSEVTSELLTVRLAANPICLNCYVELTECNARPCDKCGWPLCGQCTDHGTECEFTMKHRRSKINVPVEEFGEPRSIYALVGVARALALRDSHPESYQRLMNLQDVPKVVTGSDAPAAIAKAAQFARAFFNLDDSEEPVIRKIYGIIMVNSFSTKTMSNHPYCAVYDRTSYIEHSCRPNCAKTATEQGGVIYSAAKIIGKGEHISTTYIKPFWGTKQRKIHLYVTKFFECFCERCKDPSEFGTMFNSMKCIKPDCDGHSFPPNFNMTKSNFPDFVCYKCLTPMPPELSNAIEEDIIKDRDLLNKDSLEDCEKFIAKWSPYLHENNCYITDVQWTMIQAFVDACPDLPRKSEEYLANMVKICTKLGNLFRILAPAETKARASILCLKFQAVRIWNRMKSMDVDETIRSVEECLKDLEAVRRLMSCGPSDPGEELTLKSVCQFIEDLGEFKEMARDMSPDMLRDIWFGSS